MSRFVVVERDAARRDSLRFVLNQAGYEVTLIESLRAAASQLENADLLIIGDADLSLLNQLSQADPPSLIPVLALINPGNFVGILQCLRGGVAKIVSRQRSSNEILEQIRLLLISFRSDSTARNFYGCSGLYCATIHRAAAVTSASWFGVQSSRCVPVI